MPKRSRESSKERIKRKIKRWSEKLKRHEEEDSDSDSPVLQPGDFFEINDETVAEENLDQPRDNFITSALPKLETSPIASTPRAEPLPQEIITSETLDSDILQILGEDPASRVIYGPEVRKELSSRLLQVVLDGLSPDIRKELLGRYQIPANCLQIDAPQLNPEIRAAISESTAKRDKGIEAKQKQMASALACLSIVIDSQLGSKTKDNVTLQKLVDISRILCDIQHTDSITRRNFILYAVKPEMKDHLKSTKISEFLFGENLTEALRAAKAVNKSGTELKADLVNKNNTTARVRPSNGPRHLNRRAPAQTYRPPGQAPLYPPRPQQWIPRPAHPRAQHPPPPPRHALSSRPSAMYHAPPQRRY